MCVSCWPRKRRATDPGRQPAGVTDPIRGGLDEAAAAFPVGPGDPPRAADQQRQVRTLKPIDEQGRVVLPESSDQVVALLPPKLS
jgi:hypothetical protein